MGTEIRAERRQVWRALVDPCEIPRWRPGFESDVERDADWPQAGSSWLWRANLKGLPIHVRCRPTRVVRGEQLRSVLELGLFRAEEALCLQPLGPKLTRLSVRVSCGSEMVLLGSSLDRFAVRRFATELAAASAQALRDWCEREQAPDAAGAAELADASAQGFASR